jgi:hypothetical protein
MRPGVNKMADKDVERNVRSTTEEGIRTPTQKHMGGIAEEHSITFGDKTGEVQTKGAWREVGRPG